MEQKDKHDINKLLENPINYVNENYPDEYSLAGIDSLISELNNEIDKQNNHLIKLFRDKAISGQLAHERFERLQSATNELISQISDIHEQSKKGEGVLKILSADIRALHNAKINICNTITALKRLLMLTNMLRDLSERAKVRNYKEASGYVVVIKELRESIDILKNAPPVLKLVNSCDLLLDQLKDQLIEDLEIALNLRCTDLLPESPYELDNLCLCADSLGDSVRVHIASKYSSTLAQSYKNTFIVDLDLKFIENINQRFSWIRRSINDFDEKYGDLIPSNWNMQISGVWACTELIKDQIMDSLSLFYQEMTANMILSCLLRCKEFEEEMDSRLSDYTSEAKEPSEVTLEYPEVLKPIDSISVNKSYKSLKGTLSRCFESYLGPWIASEESQLTDLFNRIISDDAQDNAILMVLCSSKELFSALNTRLQATVSISCEQTLFEMFLVFRRMVGRYLQHLRSRTEQLNKIRDLELLTKFSGYIIATCDYCNETLEQLAEEISNLISPAYQDLITFTAEKELKRQIPELFASYLQLEKMSGLKSDAFKVLYDSMRDFGLLVKNPLAMREVNGPSDELRKIKELVIQSLDYSIHYLPNLYISHITNKITRNVLTHFKDALFSLDAISEPATQQLLLDSYDLRKFLLEEVKNIVDPLPIGYTESIRAELDNLQTLIKVLTTTDHDFDAYQGTKSHQWTLLAECSSLRAILCKNCPYTSLRYISPLLHLYGIQACYWRMAVRVVVRSWI